MCVFLCLPPVVLGLLDEKDRAIHVHLVLLGFIFQNTFVLHVYVLSSDATWFQVLEGPLP